MKHFLAIIALLLAGAATNAHADDTFVLIARSGTILDSKASGSGWDVWPVTAPEPFVKISVFENVKHEQVDYGETNYARDTYTPIWNKDIAKVFEGDLIKIEVWDKDLRYDDLISKYSFTLSRSMIDKKIFTVRFGRVHELRFELRRAD